MSHERKDGKINLKNEARTPPELFRKLDEKYHFELDAACSPDNCIVKTGYGYARGDNALAADWSNYTMDNGEYASIFYCNPPYSNPAPFIEKAHLESHKGAKVVMLLPADTSTVSFHEHVMKANEIIFLKGRVTFNNPDGTPMVGSPKFGSMIVVFERMQYQPKRVTVLSWDWKNEELP
jgi:phage N-6-adenine-methyltransferase